MFINIEMAKTSKDNFEFIGFGLGLRPKHIPAILSRETKIDWFEAISENYFELNKIQNGGLPIHNLEKIRCIYPVALHGVSMSIASVDELNLHYLKNLKKLVDRIEPLWVSDHICFSSVHGVELHDLLPVPYTQESVNHISRKILKVQDYLKRNLMIENVSSYLEYQSSEMSEWEFINQIIKKTNCKILLDVNNVYVSSKNHSFNAETFIKAIPTEAIGQIHLAGHSKGKNLLIDTHDEPVCEDVWKLYNKTIQFHGLKNTMIERDANIPDLLELENELDKARNIASSLTKQEIRKYPYEITTQKININSVSI